MFNQSLNIATYIVNLYGHLSSVCGSRHTLFWPASLHIPPVCQHVYSVSWRILAVVLTCVSNGRDVSSEGQLNEVNGHYQNRGLLVAQQEGGRPMSWVVWRLSAKHANCFPAETAAVDQTWWAEQMETMLCDGAGAVTDKALHPLAGSFNTKHWGLILVCARYKTRHLY